MLFTRTTFTRRRTEMARKGQVIENLAGWQEGLGGEDFLRDLVQRTVQQVLEAEMTSFLGAETYQRNEVRRGWRNGYKPRTLKTRVGELELMVPKDRDGQFQTELFERYQRSEKALVLALLQMYIEGVLVGIGIGAAGYREVLGCWVAESESDVSWGAVFLELKQRGLRGVRYVVSDDHAGMVRAIERHFQGAVWQRCQVHFVRNALALCGRQQRPQVLRLMKAVTESATREAAM